MAQRTQGILPFCLMTCFVFRVLKCYPRALCFPGFEIPIDWRALPPCEVRASARIPRNPLMLMKKGWSPLLSTTLFLHLLFLLPGMPSLPPPSHITLNHNSQIYFIGKTLSLEIIMFVYWFTCGMSVCITLHPLLECKFQGTQTHNSTSQFLGKKIMTNT